ncbi:methyl-accepting chemotaxis protein [Amphritea balenae]|uniref:Methyl-accepting chemotaxis protein n=1 Tax=Amphritea balenae TaxID=452629 RepID=A0A3P1SVW8_9GAMM|nr:methyl-accepting chemotaxis protein [Amphritea balenae]RRD01105.1 methyl-accepting chemotaxis protein [Amphritea balenae]GGK59924.1 methyl-accepting chemotaxis protein [Amphritea balenae]
MTISINKRLTIMVVAPVSLLAIILIAFTYFENRMLSDQQLDNTGKNLMLIKRDEVKAYTVLAYNSVKHIYEAGGTLEQALPILRNLKYGESGYFFGYTGSGVRTFMGATEKGIGKNYWDLQDSDGVYIIRDLVNEGKQGGGFVSYRFPKPGQEQPEQKLSYAIFFERWDLMVGTGFYLDDVNSILGSLETTAEDSLTSLMSYFIVISLLVMLVSIVFGSLLKRSVMRPLSKISESMKKLSTGEGDLTSRMDVDGEHELGVLAKNFNSFIASQQSMIKEVVGLADEVNQNSTDIREQMAQVTELLNQQQVEIEHSASAMNEMSATAYDIASNTAETANSTNDSKDNLQQAEGSVIELTEAVKVLAQDVGSSNEAISTLETNVQDIISIVGVIQEIAEQTNLLALNAAIEAARAGEQGRGFAVVADEVRTLATRTQSSTLEVHESIEKLKKASVVAVKTMQNSFKQSDLAVSQSETGVLELQKVTGHMNNIQEMATVIATAAEEQSQVCENLNKTVTEIAGHSEMSTQIAKENSHSVQQLSDDAERLLQLVGRFRVE